PVPRTRKEPEFVAPNWSSHPAARVVPFANGGNHRHGPCLQSIVEVVRLQRLIREVRRKRSAVDIAAVARDDVDERAAAFCLRGRAAGLHRHLANRRLIEAAHPVAGRDERAPEHAVTQLLEVAGARAMNGEAGLKFTTAAADILGGGTTGENGARNERRVLVDGGTRGKLFGNGPVEYALL